MFEPENIEECEKSVVKTIQELEQENKRLHDEKTNLMDIEAKLQSKVNEEVATRKQENEELKIEVEALKKRCEQLTRFLNKQTTKEID
jgi:predicted RNase H-like nuclease (RuvC/YqgF family)